ncbi:endonuclease-3 [Anaerosolibacter carboniphilus]|uniref:Endonuclease III n=1 Tax=Anaerosolibacter carboniphilus TaxID=1417629 RepID=A0A841KME7_9FIRM|nr:endonuclease III [Anaerosolibacter carboniphilus]MBB6214617.1 endonuclease-3 [Anaerosolibacter carboniphilus]
MGKKKSKVLEILDILDTTYPDAHCELNHENPFQLLIATILSAQTTDKKVNQVTPGLFEKYKTPRDFLMMTQEELEQEIKEIGLYRSKAKNILSTCRMLVEQYDSQVPNTMEELIKLPGVGRKTANVVLSNAFGVPAIAVDTHVFRVSNRIGLADAGNVEETEQQLMKNIPKDQWSKAHHTLIFHGRRTCDARKPKCETCPLLSHCNYYVKNGKQKHK